jgi:hypothetical protein
MSAYTFASERPPPGPNGFRERWAELRLRGRFRRAYGERRAPYRLWRCPPQPKALFGVVQRHR